MYKVLDAVIKAFKLNSSKQLYQVIPINPEKLADTISGQCLYKKRHSFHLLHLKKFYTTVF